MCDCGADLLMWQLLFFGMALIALILAWLAEPSSGRYERVRTWLNKRSNTRKRQ